MRPLVRSGVRHVREDRGAGLGNNRHGQPNGRPACIDFLKREGETSVPTAGLRDRGEGQGPSPSRPVRDAVEGGGAEEARGGREPRSFRRVTERIEQRVGHCDRHATHPQIVGWEDVELIPLSDRDRLDRDELRQEKT